MMKKLILEYDNKIEHYWPEKTDGIGIEHLAFFLIDDVGCHSMKFYKEWLNNQENLVGGGNYSHLEKTGNKIFIHFEYDWFHETPDAPIFETTVEQLNYILDRWQEACEKKPKKIVITHDNDKVSVDFEN